MIAATLKKREQGPARERQAHGSTAPGKTLPANLPEASKGQAREKAARRLNVSPRSVDLAEKVETKGTPALVKAVRDGRVRTSAGAT